MIFKATVSETLVNRVTYYVEAKGQVDAEEKFTKGETVDEILVAHDGVINREVHYDTVQRVR